MEKFLARGHGIIGVVDSDPMRKEWVKNQCMSEDLLNVLHQDFENGMYDLHDKQIQIARMDVA